MARAYLLIQTEPGHQSRTKSLISSLYGNKGVKAVDVVTGPYDVIVVIESNDSADLIKLASEISHIDNIKSSSVNPVEEY